MSLDSIRLDEAFTLLDSLFSKKAVDPAWLVVGGGAALLAQRLSARPTKDVDVMALREWEGNLIGAYPLPEAIKTAACTVARELRLDPDWLNSSASLHFFDLALLPDWFWQDLDTREYGTRLKVSFIRRRGLILLKIYAALNRDQQRDFDDLTQLAPTADEACEALDWLLTTIFGRPTHHRLPLILNHLGHADLTASYPDPA